MARNRPSRLTSLTTNNGQLARQAKRLARQQKKIENELIAEMQTSPTLIGAKGRAITIRDVKELEPLTDTQADFFSSYESNDADAYVLYGSAGTGKTTLALYFALLDVLDQETPYKKIVIIRSSCQTRQQGHLPGTVDEKMAEFEAPYHGICYDLTGRKDAYEKLKDMGLIEFVSTSFLRGMTFNNSIIVLDEAANLTWHEASTVCSRYGKNTKMIVCGDMAQNDLITNRNDVSGFREFLDVSRQMPEFRHFKFTSSDIVRSGFVKSWIMACEKLGL